MRLAERLLDSDCFKRRKATEDTKRKIVDWDIWECADPEFHHEYDRTVTMYVQSGEAVLTFTEGSSVDIQAGDTLTIYKGSTASWTIKQAIKNSYCYHDTFVSASSRNLSGKS